MLLLADFCKVVYYLTFSVTLSSDDRLFRLWNGNKYSPQPPNSFFEGSFFLGDNPPGATGFESDSFPIFLVISFWESDSSPIYY